MLLCLSLFLTLKVCVRRPTVAAGFSPHGRLDNFCAGDHLVRLAAAFALAKFGVEPLVRHGLEFPVIDRWQDHTYSDVIVLYSTQE